MARVKLALMLGLLILVVSLALGDSLNPSTVAPALYLATTEHPRRHVGGFIVGFFSVNLFAGLLIMLGPGQLLLALIPRPAPTTKHLIEVIGGAFILALAVLLWSKRKSLARRKLPTATTRGGSSLALGAGIGAIELPTALPYLAAIAAITESGFSLSVRLSLLITYNVIFVLPLVAILVAVEVLGKNAVRVLTRTNRWLQEKWPLLLAGLGLMVGIVILVVGVVGIATTPPG